MTSTVVTFIGDLDSPLGVLAYAWSYQVEADHPDQPHLRVPVVHQAGAEDRQRARHPICQGGTTPSDNMAPVCRRHHRLKTHASWRYTMLEPGTFLWTSPHCYQFLRDHHGALDVSHDRRPPPEE